jgi:hypothetical protein
MLAGSEVITRVAFAMARNDDPCGAGGLTIVLSLSCAGIGGVERMSAGRERMVVVSWGAAGKVGIVDKIGEVRVLVRSGLTESTCKSGNDFLADEPGLDEAIPKASKTLLAVFRLPWVYLLCVLRSEAVSDESPSLSLSMPSAMEGVREGFPLVHQAPTQSPIDGRWACPCECRR